MPTRCLKSKHFISSDYLSQPNCLIPNPEYFLTCSGNISDFSVFISFLLIVFDSDMLSMNNNIMFPTVLEQFENTLASNKYNHPIQYDVWVCLLGYSTNAQACQFQS